MDSVPLDHVVLGIRRNNREAILELGQPYGVDVLRTHVDLPGRRAGAVSGTVTFTAASRDRMAGSFDLSLDDGGRVAGSFDVEIVNPAPPPIGD